MKVMKGTYDQWLCTDFTVTCIRYTLYNEMYTYTIHIMRVIIKALTTPRCCYVNNRLEIVTSVFGIVINSPGILKAANLSHYSKLWHVDQYLNCTLRNNSWNIFLSDLHTRDLRIWVATRDGSLEIVIWLGNTHSFSFWRYFNAPNWVVYLCAVTLYRRHFIFVKGLRLHSVFYNKFDDFPRDKYFRFKFSRMIGLK